MKTLTTMLLIGCMCSCATKHKVRIYNTSEPLEVAFSKHVQIQAATKDARALAPAVQSASEDLEIAKSDLGVSFSGGGTRSAIATLGQLKGLHEAGLLGKVKYISCVSGGSWCALPFTFYEGELAEFWGNSDGINPENMTLQDVRNPGLYGKMGKAVTRATVTLKMFVNWLLLSGDESYSQVLNCALLEPLGLHKHKYFTLTDETRRELIRLNGGKLDDDDFYTARPDRPFLVVNTCVRTRSVEHGGKYKNIPWEITPLYVGTPVMYNFAGGANRHWMISPSYWLDPDHTPIGGGFIDPMGFDSTFVRDVPDREQNSTTREVEVLSGCIRMPGVRSRFTLSDAIAASGAAPSIIFAAGDTLGFPEFNIFPYKLTNQTHAAFKAEEHLFGDGGFTDNSGVMALLRRKVGTIVMFCNAEQAFAETDTGHEVDSYLSSLFGVNPETKHFTQHYSQVFPHEEYARVIGAFKEAKMQGKPLIFNGVVNVLQNDQFGVAAYENCNLVIYYLGPIISRSSDNLWANLPSISALLDHPTVHAHAKNFPHYKTFLENWNEGVILYSAEQVNLLASMTQWQVKNYIASEIRKAIERKAGK